MATTTMEFENPSTKATMTTTAEIETRYWNTETGPNLSNIGISTPAGLPGFVLQLRDSVGTILQRFDFRVDTASSLIIHDNTNNRTLCTFYSGGVFKSHYKPFFSVRNNTTTTTASGSVIPFQTVDFNNRSGYNGINRFTAPMDGIYYFFHCCNNHSSQPTGTFSTTLYKNGVDQIYRTFHNWSSSGYRGSPAISYLVSMATSDYVEVRARSGSAVVSGGNGAHWVGLLIG